MDEHLNRHKPVVVAVGAGVQDVFLSGAILTPQYDNGQWEEQFKLGEKYQLENITFSTGGGGTNAAVTFARQGLHAMFVGSLGHDPAASAILEELHKEGVDTSLARQVDHLNTGYSVLLLAPSGERAVLTYRGASEHFDLNAADLNNLHGDWLYISSLGGQMAQLESLIKAAKSTQMKIAVAPGKAELAQADWLKLLHQVDLVTLNKEELQMLVEGDSNEQLVRHASDMSAMVIMTDGPKGVTATDRQSIVTAGMYEDVPVIDRTGAGDAFGSGLVASLAKGQDLAAAIKFASANSTSVVGQIGAKAGILDSQAVLHDMPIDIKSFGQ